MAPRTTVDSAVAVDGIDDTVLSLAWSRDGRYLFIGTESNGLAAYDVEAEVLGPFVGNGAQVRALAASPDGQTLAAGLADDGSIRLLSTVTGYLERTIWPAHSGWVQTLAFSPDGELLASGGDDGALILWDPTTGEEVSRLLEGSGPIHGLAFTPNGASLVAAVQSEETFYVWDTSTWNLTLTVNGDQGEDLAVSPDGSMFATAGGGLHEANLWDTATGALVFSLSEMPGWVWAVAYDPDGSEVAAGGLGQIVVLWDTESGSPSRELYSGFNLVQALAYSPDGTMLASGGVGVLIWHLDQPQGPTP
jgi:WD40 repeat protein